MKKKIQNLLHSVQENRENTSCFNTLTPKPAVTGHSTSILVGRISAGCCSERRRKSVGRVVIKGTLREEMKGLPFIFLTIRSESKRGTGQTNPFHRSI
ncbi:hypothetical protein AVEN_172095-1, partial [Araneus ventricosus]